MTFKKYPAMTCIKDTEHHWIFCDTCMKSFLKIYFFMEIMRKQHLHGSAKVIFEQLFCILSCIDNLKELLQVRMNLQVNSFPNHVNLSQPRSICFKLDQLVSTSVSLGQVKNTGRRPQVTGRCLPIQKVS